MAQPGDGYLSPTEGYLIGPGNTAARTLAAAPVGSIGFGIAAGGSNVCEVTITVKDGSGATIARVHELTVNLSDDDDGEGLTSTTASGAVAAKSASGTDLAVFTAKKSTRVQTLKTGVYVLSITDTSKTTFYVSVTGPDGVTAVSRILATADYG